MEGLLEWYAENRRDLPWRASDTTPWGVLVSEVMLGQTPVVRVEPVWTQWLRRWPLPASLAVESRAEVIRAWGRLGYPRRALRLHASAQSIARDHDGLVPSTYEELRALPGVGDYTAAATLAFAYQQRSIVLDTNVRRVLARHEAGVALPGRSVNSAERQLAEALLPVSPPIAARWSVAVMELGALVCTAAVPRCTSCPLTATCKWRRAGSPAYAGPPRRAQSFAGTDREVRGLLLHLLRDSTEPVPKSVLDAAWPDNDQRERALDSLLSDGLVEIGDHDSYRLPR